jgi:hypothetical protein
MLRDHQGDDLRLHNERIAEASRQRRLLDGLFSDDPRRQYAALRHLELAEAISDRVYERIRAIRSDTPHLLIAETAAKLLEEKPRDIQDHISEQTRREAGALIEAQEERERQRLRRAAKEPSVIQLPSGSLVRWLTCAVAAGGLFGGLGAYAMLPRRETQRAAPAEVYIDRRSGALLSMDGDAAEDSSPRVPESGYEPAYYCWKCKQWLPQRKPQKSAGSIEGPRQSLADRPLNPKPKGK